KFAYLIGTLPDWSSLNLIEGEANIYFDNSFVGSTWLNPTSIDDSLTVSLGKDERIVVEREQLKEFSSKNFFRNKTRETFSYEIRVRNTKSEPIKITVEDQLPVSTNEEIKVTAKDLGDGYMREETGIVYWEIELQPGETKKLPLVYELEYPKGKRVAF
ncbi:MAG TPA: mucoidy inhibitor, partial [Balneolaceae bacterium]|nr:mucoidy inhibitor [Balneolaceae bacterium]